MSVSKNSKTCTKCKTNLSLEDFYTYRRKNSDKLCYMSKCKTCHKKEVYARAKNNNYYRKNNKKYCKKFYKNNKDYFRKYSREYIRNRRERDKDFRLKDKISTQVYQYCAGMNLSKTNSFWTTISYTPEELRVHLEQQFWYGMTWDNYGEWHIDHIKPKSKFKISEYGDDQFIECWSLANLQPLWGEDNVLKSNKFWGKS